ncbi:hypothetical protein [Clostridium hydrogeniformans]|uniref:hypothetical protein n=1 Tax=Clostridium hydrogeniformans TaxID=349933 RepID=UPI0004833AED|nr:hypothetical protein [Clostridium hydrogeniformans]
MKIKKYMKAFVIVIFFIILTIKPSIAEAEEGFKVIESLGNEEYSSQEDLPEKIYYNEHGFQGTLYLKEKRVSSGKAPETKYYSEDVDFIVSDYSQWNRYSGFMNFKYQTGWLAYSKTVNKDGYSFETYLDSSKYHEHITKYAAPQYEKRGKSSYDEYSISEERWIGNGNVTHGSQYHTANHYYKGQYTGEYTTKDTRKWKGLYSGRVVNIKPIKPSISIKDYKYLEPGTNKKWVNTKDQFIITTSICSYDEYDRYPTITSLLIGGNGSDNEPYDGTKLVATKNGVTSKGSEGVSKFKYQDYIAKEIPGSKTLEADHKLIADKSTSGLNFPIYTQGGTNSSEWFYSNIFKSIDILAVDGHAPVLVGSLPTESWNKDNVTFELVFKDKDSGIKEIELYEGTKKLVSNKFSNKKEGSIIYNVQDEGIHSYKVIARDNVGNVVEETFTIRLDKTKPSINGNTSYGWTKDNVSVYLYGKDSLSGMASMELYNSKNEIVATGSNIINYIVRSEGVNIFRIIARDKAGNVSEKLIDVKIDRTAPKGTVSFSFDKNNFDLGVSVKDIVERESGINKITAEYSNSNNPSKSYIEVLENGIKDQVLTNSDLNEDGIVDDKDVRLISIYNNSLFGDKSYDSKYDLNYDGKIDLKDIAIVNKDIGKSYTFTGGRNITKILGNSISAKVKVKAIDNCGNERILREETYMLNTNPNSQLDVTKYSYKDNNIYWVRPNEEFEITSKSFFPREFNVFPTRNYVSFVNNDETSIDSCDTEGRYKSGESYESNFTQVNKGIYAKRIQENSSNILVGIHTLKAKIDGAEYKLFSNGSYDKYLGGYVNSLRWLKIDGTAPVADKVEISKQTSRELYLDIFNLRDYSGQNKVGSGLDLNNLYVEYQPLVNGKPSGVKETSKAYISLSRNNYRLKIDFYNSNNKDVYGDYMIKVFSKDNVGNVGIIFDKIIKREELTIEGVIVPNPAPRGKLLSVNIKTTGYATKLKVKFPEELVSLATQEDPLILEKNVEVEATHTELFRMRLPYDSKVTLDEGKRVKEEYKVYIEAQNEYGDKVNAWLKLDVQDSITTGVKIRIRGTGYDQE